MARNLINAAHIKSMKPRPGCKLTKYHDGEGLYLWVYDDGKRNYKRWFFRYRLNGINKPEMLLGSWPDMQAAEAREKADEARALLKNGVDPVINRKAEKAAQQKRDANSFEIVAREWFAVQMADKADSHKDKVIASLEKDAFPFIGGRPLTDVTPVEMLEVLRRIESRGAVETAHRVMNRCSQVFRYGVATGRCTSDPTRDLRGALKPIKKGHFSATTDPATVGEILRACDSYHGSFIVTCALRLAPLLFTRPGEIRVAKWADVDFAAREWRFKVSKTKNSGVTDLIVPLSRQALAILEEVKKYAVNSPYVFPGANAIDRPISNVALIAALRRMGITGDEMTVHGWRATARTILEEVLQYPAHIIEHQLAHTVKGPLGRAYNRTTHIEARREMMQAWADFLDELKATDRPDIKALAQKYKYKS